MSNQMDVITALDILRRAPAEAFKNHTNETIATLQHMEEMLDGCSGSTIPLNSRLDQTPRNVEPTTTAGQNKQKNGKDSREKPNPSIELFKEVIKNLPCMEGLLKKRPASIIARKRAHQSDQRLDDILRFEGTRHKKATHTVENKLLNGGAQRSLALQYSRHQAQLGESERVSEVCDALSQKHPDPKILHRRRGGNVRSWIRIHLKFADEDENIIVMAINSGIKQLVVEKLIQRRLERAGSPLKASGISAVTALTIQKFKALRLQDVPSFIDLIFKKPSENILSGDQLETNAGNSPISPIILICKFSHWFTKFQQKYDQTISSNQRLRSKQFCVSPPSSGDEVEEDEPPVPSSRNTPYQPYGPRRDQLSLSPPASLQNESDLATASDCSDYEPFPAQTLDSSSHHPCEEALGRSPVLCDQLPTSLGTNHREESLRPQQEFSREGNAIIESGIQFETNTEISTPICHHSGPIISDIRTGGVPYQASQQFQVPVCDQGMQGANENLAGFQESQATQHNLAYGFDNHNLTASPWTSGQARDPNIEILEGEQNRPHNSVIGFDICRQPATRALQLQSSPHCVRGFDTPHLELTTLSSNQTQEFESFQNQNRNNLAHGFDGMNDGSISWVSGLF